MSSGNNVSFSGLAKSPWFCWHWKYRSPLTAPSFLPLASSSSTPVQIPLENSPRPTKRTVPTPGTARGGGGGGGIFSVRHPCRAREARKSSGQRHERKRGAVRAGMAATRVRESKMGSMSGCLFSGAVCRPDLLCASHGRRARSALGLTLSQEPWLEAAMLPHLVAPSSPIGVLWSQTDLKGDAG